MWENWLSVCNVKFIKYKKLKDFFFNSQLYIAT